MVLIGLLWYAYFWLKHDRDSHFNAQQVELSNPDAELRLLEVFYHKIYKVRAFTFVNLDGLCEKFPQ
jgi:hypothetical protein